MGLVTVLSLISFSDPSIENVGFPHLDKVVHFTFYFMATILGCLFARERTSGRIKMAKAAIIFFAVNIVYGTIIEIVQLSPTIERDGNVYDAIANTTGALLGVVVVYRLFSPKGYLNWEM